MNAQTAVPVLNRGEGPAAAAFAPDRWHECGDASAGTALMLHSLGLDGRAFAALWRALPKGWRLISYDQLGHGAAAGATDFTFADCVADALRALDLAPGPVHVLGHSMGGAVAACAAASAPGKVASLTLVATPPAGMPVFVERGQAALDGGMDAVVAPTLARWFGPDGSAGNADAIAYARSALHAMAPAGFAAAWRALASFGGYADLAAALPPTLCVAGALDLSTPPPALQAICDALRTGQGQPGAGEAARVETIAGHGHMLPLTAPEALARLLAAHWSRCGGNEAPR